MKVLTINENKAYFLKKEKNDYIEEIITNITAEDIKNIMMLIIENDIEKCETENVNILNEAEKIIYDNLSKKLNEIIERKNQIFLNANTKLENLKSKLIKEV